jgi:L-threonylcarbamoyladenylate synthase
MSDRPLILSATGPLDAAVDAFRAGGVIACPTETFYGLCVDPFDAGAVRRLFELKGRGFDKPVSCIVKDVEMLWTIAAEVPPAALILIERFWPGPLTIVFKARPHIPPGLLAGTGRIGARVSSDAVARRLVDALGSPMTATSANPAGKAPAVTAREVAGYFDGSVDVVIDGGRAPGGMPSTVVDVTGDEVVVVREGAVPASEVVALVGDP